MNILPDTPSPVNLIDDLSDWSCDPLTCGIDGTACHACQRRQRVAKLLAQRDLERLPCTFDCTALRPCERCEEVRDYLAWLYTQRDQVAILLRSLRQVAQVFPEEFRELLVDPILDIIQEVQP